MVDDEIWKPIDSCDGYEVSNYGRVRSVSRLVKRSYNGIDNSFVLKGRILKGRASKVGGRQKYIYVKLPDEKRKPKNKSVHRLVANAFIPNPLHLPFVNHKDQDGTNNHVDNLEWCTVAYNNSYGDAIERRASKQRRKVLQFTIDGTLITEYDSLSEAEAKTGVRKQYISLCIKGKRKTAKGYIWRKKE